jgi:uncharacterized protein YlxW (UPF0749 family)
VDPTILGTGGVAVVLASVIAYLLRQNHLDRRQYQTHIAEVEKRTAEAIAKSAARSEAEIAGLRTEVHQLRTELEHERRLRWAAEDDAAKYRRLHELGAPPQGGTT